MNKKISSLVAVIFCFWASFMAGIADAEIVWDFSPDATGAGVVTPWYTNQLGTQQLSEKIAFSDQTTLSSMDIYSYIDAGEVNQLVRIYIWSNNGGIPGVLLHEFDETVNIIDTQGTVSQPILTRKHADFTTPVDLPSGTYWIAMTSVTAGVSLGQATLAAVDDDQFAWCHSGSFSSMSSIGTGDMAFRLHGTRPHNTWLIDTIEATKSFELQDSSRSMALDSSGRPHIVYGGDHLYHAFFDGAVWHTEIIDSTPGVGTQASVAIDGDDHLHIIYGYSIEISSHGDGPYYRYATNASGQWIFEDLNIIPLAAYHPTMNIDPSGAIHLLWTFPAGTGASGSNIHHTTNASGAWTDETTELWGSVCDWVVDVDGTVHLLYQNLQNYPDVEITYAVKSNGAWETSTIQDTDYGPSGGLAMDGNGEVHIAHSDGTSGNLYYVHGLLNSWQSEIIEDLGERLRRIVLDIDSSGQVHIAYQDPASGDLKYARGTTGSWTTETVDADGSATSIGVTPGSVPHICYSGSEAIMHATISGGSWVQNTIEPWVATNPRVSAAAVDAAGTVHVLYHDSQGYHYGTGTYGSWKNETVPTGASWWPLNMDIDSSGNAHAVFENTLNQDSLLYLNNSLGSWEEEEISFPGLYYLSQPTIAIGPGSSVHFVVLAYDNIWTAHWLYGFRSGGTWQFEEFHDYSEYYIFDFDFTVDQDGYVHIAGANYDIFTGIGYLFYDTNAGGAWNHTETNLGDFNISKARIVVDSNRTPHIFYYGDNAQGEGCLRYRYRAGGIWTDTMLMTGFNTINYVKAAIAGDDRIHLNFASDNNRELKYAVGRLNDWTIETVESGLYYLDNDIAVDADNKPHIVYHEGGNQNIKYATLASNEEHGPDGDNPLYDGDGSGTPDCQEDNVASFHTYDGTEYITLSAPSDTTLQSVEPVDNPSPINTPDGITFPFGFIKFMIADVTPGGAITVELYLPPGTTVSTYYKYGPTPLNPMPHWYEFLYDGTTGAVISGNIITLYLVDGLRGDHDLTVNGVIVEPGAPGVVEIQGDLDGDGDVDGADRNILMASLRQCTGNPAYNPEADFDNDGCVTFLDYRQWYIYYKNFVSGL